MQNKYPIILALILALVSSGCLDMSIEHPTFEKCPNGFSRLSAIFTQCPAGKECRPLSDGKLCVENPLTDPSGGAGPNCPANFITLSPTETKYCSGEIAMLPEELGDPVSGRDSFLCLYGHQDGRLCRKAISDNTDTTTASLPVLQGQRCTAEQRNAPKDSLRIHIIDVGQGDAIWVQSPTGQNVLIDGGDSGAFGRTSAGPIVTDYLEFNGFPPNSNFDAVFLTHPHADHFGGFPVIFKNYTFSNYIDPMQIATTNELPSSYITWVSSVVSKLPVQNIYMPAEDKFNAGERMPDDFFGPKVVSEFILAPQKFTTANDLNNTSIMFRISYAGKSFLFTGDAEAQAETKAIELGNSIGTNLVQSNFLKVCHHGSSTSSSPSFLHAIWDAIDIQDRGAYISSGRKSYSGSIIPSANVIARLKDFVAEKNILSTSAGDDYKNEGEEYRDDNILVVVKPDGSHYSCYSGTN